MTETLKPSGIVFFLIVTLGFGVMVWFGPNFRVGSTAPFVNILVVFVIMALGPLAYWLGTRKKAIADKPLKKSDWLQSS